MSDPRLDWFTAQRCRTLRRKLLRWYAQAARPLPWRATSDPYRIWLSEIMLQQTTVKAVIPYYERFLARFPDVQALADADEAHVLQLWEGLGYYSRGRNLRFAAQTICAQHNGAFPSDLAQLQSLPGIGRYTAGAIRSFAFDLPAPIVEANTLRLYCRLLGYDGNPRGRAGQELLWAFAQRLQPSRSAGHVNQALMELGATVCTPSAPRCPECPLKTLCVAAAEGRQTEIPVKQSRPEVTQTVEALIALRRGERYLIRRRADDERWAGMWDFLRFPISSIRPDERLTDRAWTRLQAEAGRLLHPWTAGACPPLDVLQEIRHSVTRYRIRLICLMGELRVETRELRAKRPMPAEGAGEWKWAGLEAIAQLPLPVTGRQLAEALAKQQG
jgi:A/G-specific adenine glycosylase